ncbi:hypothetical protein H7K14_20240 [Mycolicibacter longobardus]|uniref:type VII secretion target n=1 Tax=Mycolicibacter longobardus TaxID=1108812 RepID=UPI0021F282B0|nr:type VII secretion target [Mycolicibacter longobardus]MCV7386145.1 hypothetical protein [Mycolicibacter longobardus]
MTSPVLQVTPAGLRELAQRCHALAVQVSPTLSPVTASEWQASGAAVSTVNASGAKAAAAIRGRMTASASKLTTAAREYEAMDHDGAAALAAVRPSFTPLVARSSTDGGAGGLGIPR